MQIYYYRVQFGLVKKRSVCVVKHLFRCVIYYIPKSDFPT